MKPRNATGKWSERYALPSFIVPCAHQRDGEPRGVVSG